MSLRAPCRSGRSLAVREERQGEEGGLDSGWQPSWAPGAAQQRERKGRLGAFFALKTLPFQQRTLNLKNMNLLS